MIDRPTRRGRSRPPGQGRFQRGHGAVECVSRGPESETRGEKRRRSVAVVSYEGKGHGRSACASRARRRRHVVLGHGDGLARVPQTFDQAWTTACVPMICELEQFPRLVLPLEALALQSCSSSSKQRSANWSNMATLWGAALKHRAVFNAETHSLPQINKSGSPSSPAGKLSMRIGAVPPKTRVREVLTP